MINGSKIVLTGANSGIGLAVLKLLLLGDNRILAVDKNTDTLEKLDDSKITIMKCDVGSAEGVDAIFDKADEVLGGIDIFYANAGFPYYEKFDYTDWNRMEHMFDTNVYSPMYTYSKYVKYLNGKPGKLAITISAMGKMGMPGFAVYGATKFAVQGFQECIRLEMPSNLKMTCLYPIATNTNFFKAANERDFKWPSPVQQPEVVAKKMVKGIEKGKKSVSPSKLFGFARVLMAICPPVRTIYWNMEKKNFNSFVDGQK